MHLRLVDDIDATRPRTRGECANIERPCPFVGCRSNLYLDVNEENGSIKFNFPDKEPEEVEPNRSCALDIAEHGGGTLEDISTLSNVTRERIRQIEGKALARIRKRAGLRSNDATRLREYCNVPNEAEATGGAGAGTEKMFAGKPNVERNEDDDTPDDGAPPVAISFFADAGDDDAALADPAWDRTLRADEQYLARFHLMLGRFGGRDALQPQQSNDEPVTLDDDTQKENTMTDPATLPPGLANVFKARNDLIAAGKEPTALAIANHAKVTGKNDKARTAIVYTAVSQLRKRGFITDAGPKAAPTKSAHRTPPTTSAPRPARASSANPVVAALIEKRDALRKRADALDVAIEELSEVL